MQGTDVNLDVLLKKNFKSKELVRGRALMQAADEGIKNMKKAWLFAQKYLDEAGNPKISGIIQWRLLGAKCFMICGLQQKKPL